MQKLEIEGELTIFTAAKQKTQLLVALYDSGDATQATLTQLELRLADMQTLLKPLPAG